jgi:hypothetical protein
MFLRDGLFVFAILEVLPPPILLIESRIIFGPLELHPAV